MQFSFSIGSILLSLTAAISLTTAHLVWQRHHVPGSKSLALLLASVAIWAGCDAIMFAVSSLQLKMSASQLSYLGIVNVAPLWLTFALSYSRPNRLLTRRASGLLWIIPLLTLVLVATNPLHGLIWREITLAPGALGVGLKFGHGSWFWIMVAYFYLLMLAGTIALFWAIIRFPAYYRRQAEIMLTASAIPWFANILYLTDTSPLPGFDVTPLAFAFAALLCALAMYIHRLFDLTPVARDTLIERMDDGLIVLDLRDRIVDINPAARRLLNLDRSPIGVPIMSALADWPDLLAYCDGTNESQFELYVANPLPCYFELQMALLRDKAQRYTGRMLVLRDVTAHKRTETELYAANAQLQRRLAEIATLQIELSEQTLRDPLTGLFNRRYLQQISERELARVVRDGRPLSFVVIDLDKFKRLNDTFGHRAGDLVLQHLADMLRSNTRAGDIACRYGGEEFVVVLPGMGAEAAKRRVEEWRVAMETAALDYNNATLKMTFSAGIAIAPNHGLTEEALFHAADQALYQAKAAGRNRVVVWNMTPIRSNVVCLPVSQD